MERGAQSILVVDDEPALVKLVSVYLRKLGYTVATTMDAESAWSVFAGSPGEFAVAVVDGSIAGSGPEDLAVRLLRANPRLCVIVSSGYPLDMTAMRAVAEGRTMFLQKPYTSGMLLSAVRGILAAQEEI